MVDGCWDVCERGCLLCIRLLPNLDWSTVYGLHESHIHCYGWLATDGRWQNKTTMPTRMRCGVTICNLCARWSECLKWKWYARTPHTRWWWKQDKTTQQGMMTFWIKHARNDPLRKCPFNYYVTEFWMNIWWRNGLKIEPLFKAAADNPTEAIANWM